MSGEINRLPAGLLSILDMKSRGNAPRQLSDTLAGVLELSPLYLETERKTLSAGTSSVINASGIFFAGIGSPTSILWVHNVSIRSSVALAAGTSYRCRFYYSSPAANVMFRGPAAQGAAGDQPTAASETPFLLSPGWGYGVWCEQVTIGTAQQWIVTMDYTLLAV